MDRGRKAMPVQNKACMERHVQRCQERHQQKLRDMKCSIDNECPRAASHLKNKAKKNAIIEEKCAQIEAENRLLLEKMSHILRTKGGIDCTNDSVNYSHPLSKERRKRELQRITKANQKILERIECARPTYNHKKWEDEAKRNNDILQNICEFKPQHVQVNDRKDEDSIFGYMDFYESIPEHSGK
ncbi:hypothetical protein ACHAW5_000037 [Stephanodiscus triporus]|uniref:Uncharacterized protein n=1 Tax=Stephanodiscus triporus TaxID=2934178 RepID=A0ABD3MJB3_9STRA